MFYHLHRCLLVVVFMKAGPVLEDVGQVIPLLVTDAESHLPLHHGDVGVVDEPLVVEQTLHIHGGSITQHVVGRYDFRLF